jgi:hypothetical protein
MVDNRYKGNLLGRCLRNPSIRASLRLHVNDKHLYGLRAITPAFLDLLRTICGLINALLHVRVQK